MEENNFNNFEEKRKLPNATTVLVLGIASIVTCCCYGIISIILGVIGLVLAKKDGQLYNENPSLYTNYGNLNTGKILCIIGIILGVIYLIYMIWLFSTIGMAGLQDPNVMQEKIREMMGQ